MKNTYSTILEKLLLDYSTYSNIDSVSDLATVILYSYAHCSPYYIHDPDNFTVDTYKEVKRFLRALIAYNDLYVDKEVKPTDYKYVTRVSDLISDLSPFTNLHILDDGNLRERIILEFEKYNMIAKYFTQERTPQEVLEFVEQEGELIVQNVINYEYNKIYKDEDLLVDTY